MRHLPFKKRTTAAFFAAALAALAAAARAQDIEPRAYANAPTGVNFLIAGYGYARGSPSSDPTLPIKDARLAISSALLGYARSFGLLGKSAKAEVLVPYTFLSGTAQLAGQPASRVVDGFSDPRLRLSVNFYGAPALSHEEFARYRQDTIVGASLQVIPPLGQYDASRLVNIGTNRWTFKPELGASKALGRFTLEAAFEAAVFTDNTDFLGGRRAQEPLYSTQAHAIYSTHRGVWASLDATFFTGGRTTLDGVHNDDLQRSWRAGGTLAFPIDARDSIKLYASTGLSSRTGNNYALFGGLWQYRWGGGL